jgi:hypothetical protein
MHHLPHYTGDQGMILEGNNAEVCQEKIFLGAVSDLSKSFKYSKNIPTLNLGGESCD